MSVNVDALQELAEREPRLDEYCCVCGPWSASSIVTCFGCTYTRED